MVLAKWVYFELIKDCLSESKSREFGGVCIEFKVHKNQKPRLLIGVYWLSKN